MPTLHELTVGMQIPSREHTPTNVSLFLYNAAIWNPHRIHYDESYSTTVEGHPGIVIDGPLQGDWLTQVVLDWLGEEGRLVEFEYSNRRASYLGQTLTATGRVAAVDPATGTATLDIAITDAAGQVLTPGRAVVQFHR
ncbi:MAG: hypothetical protein AB7O21_13420 [Gammaproteobacteria bacterium]